MHRGWPRIREGATGWRRCRGRGPPVGTEVCVCRAGAQVPGWLGLTRGVVRLGRSIRAGCKFAEPSPLGVEAEMQKAAPAVLLLIARGGHSTVQGQGNVSHS